MRELQDYSGDFIPDLEMETFSKSALLRLWTATSKLYTGIDGIWYTMIKEKYNEELANELDLEIWSQRATPIEVKRIREAMNINGDDAVALCKFFQIEPQFKGVGHEIDFELHDTNDATMTIQRCPALEYFERHNWSDDTISYMCNSIDKGAFQLTAHLFNPKLTITPIKTAPRNNKDEKPCCIWEIKMEG